MPREKHGRYDANRHLPDNRDQAIGTGIIVWLHAQVRQLLPDAGEALIEQSRVHHDDATKWLLARLADRTETRELPAAYHERQRKEAVERTWRNKEANARRIEELLTTEENPGRRTYLEKELAKQRRAIEKHRAQQ